MQSVQKEPGWDSLVAEYEETVRMAASKERECRDLNPYEERLWRSMKESTHFALVSLRRSLGDMSVNVEVKTEPISISNADTFDWLIYHHGILPQEDVLESGLETENELVPQILWRSILTSQQYACIMAFTHGWSERRIADYLGIGRDTVKTHLKRARLKLKRKREVPLSLFEESEGVIFS